jgi:hypothetical protein
MLLWCGRHGRLCLMCVWACWVAGGCKCGLQACSRRGVGHLCMVVAGGALRHCGSQAALVSACFSLAQQDLHRVVRAPACCLMQEVPACCACSCSGQWGVCGLSGLQSRPSEVPCWYVVCGASGLPFVALLAVALCPSGAITAAVLQPSTCFWGVAAISYVTTGMFCFQSSPMAVASWCLASVHDLDGVSVACWLSVNRHPSLHSGQVPCPCSLGSPACVGRCAACWAASCLTGPLDPPGSFLHRCGM